MNASFSSPSLIPPPPTPWLDRFDTIMSAIGCGIFAAGCVGFYAIGQLGLESLR